MSSAREWNFSLGPFMGGFTLYPYQLALGISVQYWRCIFAPSIRVHLGPFKVWCCWILKAKKDE